MNKEELDKALKAGYIYAPWIPYFKTPTVTLNDFKKRFSGLSDFVNMHNPGYRRKKLFKINPLFYNKIGLI
jgi:hypothetical protein